MTGKAIRMAGWPAAGLVVLAALLASVTPAAAQTADGTIEVVVADQSGAALPGVTVTVRAPSTGFERVTVTGGDGTAENQNAGRTGLPLHWWSSCSDARL